MSKVGIFWFFNNKPIIVSTALKQGIDDGLFINGPYDHVDNWNNVKIQHPELHIFEYEGVPRGRVLFSKKEKIFYVYIDKVLLNKNYKGIIVNEFELPISKTNFIIDDHYTTNQGDLDRLLDN